MIISSARFLLCVAFLTVTPVCAGFLEDSRRVRRNSCAHDNCLRAFIRSSIVASEFCSSYKTSTVIQPTYTQLTSHCNEDVDANGAIETPLSKRISSACSCLPTTSVSRTITTPSVTTSSPSASNQAPTSIPSDLPIPIDLSLEPPATQAPKDFKLGYVSNSTESEKLGGTVKFFEMVDSTLSYLQFETQNDSFLFTIGTPYLLCLSTSNGEGLILSLDGTTMTYFAADGRDQQSYVIPSAAVNGPAKRHIRRQGSQLPVTVDVYDSCKNPSTLANIQVDCTPLLYSQTNAAAGLVPGQTVPGILSGNGAGEYTGTCDISSILASSQNYQKCVTQSQNNLNTFCGLDQQVANNVKGFFEDLQKNVKAIAQGLEEVSKPVFKALDNFQKEVGGLIKKVNPALNFYKKFCNFLQNPIIIAEFDQEECGYPSQMSVAIEGIGFSVPLGAFSATAGAMVSTQVTLPASTACTTTSSTTSTTPSPTPAVYTSQTGNCTSFQAYGKAVFCCSGGCIDGTSIGSPGQCKYWTDVCGDVAGGPPLCGATQVRQGGNNGNWVPSGDGNCWGGGECQWVKNNWTWSCCDCPSGYTNVLLGACEGNSAVPGPCVGCSDPAQTLSGNATSGFTCS